MKLEPWSSEAMGRRGFQFPLLLFLYSAHFRFASAARGRAEVTLARGRRDGDDQLAFVLPAVWPLESPPRRWRRLKCRTKCPLPWPAARHGKRVVVGNGNGFLDQRIAFSSFKCRFLGINPAPNPWILCGPASMAGRPVSAQSPANPSGPPQWLQTMACAP